jgi:hypothetical protein
MIGMIIGIGSDRDKSSVLEGKVYRSVRLHRVARDHVPRKRDLSSRFRATSRGDESHRAK